MIRVEFVCLFFFLWKEKSQKARKAAIKALTDKSSCEIALVSVTFEKQETWELEKIWSIKWNETAFMSEKSSIARRKDHEVLDFCYWIDGDFLITL